MNLPTFFSLRFKTTMAGLVFLAEAECEDLAAATAAFRSAHSQPQEIELTAALIGLSLAKEGNRGCFLLDTESEKLFAQVLQSLKLGAEHFLNERLGSYDHINNMVTPADLGIVFPDGTVRVVWREDTALQDFDSSFAIVKGTVELLLEAQQLPFFTQTEEEIEEGDYDSVYNRRLDLLFRAGFWPSSDDEFEAESDITVEALLAQYVDRVPSVMALSA